MIVFISHSWNDKSLATHITETLQKDGHKVWYDIHQLIPGDNIQAVIDAYIEQCDAVVLLWSAHAHTSAGVQAEIATATGMGKRIIPLQVDDTPLPDRWLKGVLGIPFDDTPTGTLLLQRGLLMLMASHQHKEAAWFKEAFSNVVDLGGYLNYTNTYRIKQHKNDDGHKEQWVARLETLQKENEYIRQQLMPKAMDTMEKLQYIMQHLEAGNVPLATLQEWHQWCMDNTSFHPELMQQLKVFLEHDMQRLQDGGAPVSVLDADSAAQTIEALDAAIGDTREAAYEALFQKIKKFAGLFINDAIIDTIVTGYLHYVTGCPQLLNTLLTEAQTSEYVAVKEAVVQLLHYLQNADAEAKRQKGNLEAYFDDAYLVNHTAQLLIEAKLIAKEKLPIDTIAVNLVDKYVVFILDHQTKEKLDAILQKIRTLVGLKKDEINWGQVAAVAIGASALAALFSKTGAPANSTTGSSGASFFEDKVAEFNARFGGGLDPYQ